MDSHHQQTYAQARYYDVAFSFRDVPAECDALATWAARHGAGTVSSVLELAAGPARHAREFARRGVAATALDTSPDMNTYAQQCSIAEGLALTTVTADMTDFPLSPPVDLAMLLMDSVSYLLDNDAVLRHFEAVGRAVRPGGLYVLEMCHPRDIFRVGEASTQTTWTVRVPGDIAGTHGPTGIEDASTATDSDTDTVVETRWGTPGDPFDPITQIDDVAVWMRWSGPDGSGELHDRSRQRRFTANEIDALVRAGGQFDIVARHGAMDADRPFDNDRAAWRMVLVLRRRDGARS